MAFITCLKLRRDNSFIYSHDSLKQLASDFKVNRNTLADYRDELVRLGILKKSGKNLQAVSIKQACEILFGDRNYLKHVDYFKHTDYSKLTIGAVQEKIRFGIAAKNFKQQEFEYRRKQQVIDGIENGNMPKGVAKRAKAWCKSYNCSMDQLKSVLRPKKKVVSGKNHIATLLQVSPTTGSRFLDRWHDEGKIERKIIMKFKEIAVNHSTFDMLKRRSNCRFIIPKSKGYLLMYGSEIKLLSA